MKASRRSPALRLAGAASACAFVLATSAGAALAAPDAASSPGGGPAPIDAKTAERLERSCWATVETWLHESEAAQKRGQTYLLKDHEPLKIRVVQADQDCQHASIAFPENPTYNIQAGAIELLLALGFGESDAMHQHGMAFVKRGAVVAFHENDPESVLRACGVAKAFALGDDFRCIDSDVAKAQAQVDAVNASGDSAAARMRAANAADQQQQMMMQFIMRGTH